jgi:hypothetical protein
VRAPAEVGDNFALDFYLCHLGHGVGPDERVLEDLRGVGEGAEFAAFAEDLGAGVDIDGECDGYD